MPTQIPSSRPILPPATFPEPLVPINGSHHHRLRAVRVLLYLKYVVVRAGPSGCSTSFFALVLKICWKRQTIDSVHQTFAAGLHRNKLVRFASSLL